MIPLFRGLEAVPANFGPCVVTIGNFDGVHLGHREILSAVVREARASGAKAVAVTFTPHPEQILKPERAPLLSTPNSARFERLATTGIDAILLLEFNAELAALSGREFVERVLVEGLHVRGVHAGANFRFGRNAEAGVGQWKNSARNSAYGNSTSAIRACFCILLAQVRMAKRIDYFVRRFCSYTRAPASARSFY